MNKPLRAFLRPSLAVALSAIALAALLCACSTQTIGTSNNDKYAVFDKDTQVFTPQPVEVTSPEDGTLPEIVDEGWWAKDSYIHYGIKVSNPNANLIARDTVVQITSFDEQGNQISQEEQIIAFIGPETITGFAGECGSGQKPSKVTFEVLETGAWQNGEEYVEPLLVASLDETDKGYYRYEFTGGVTNNSGAYVSTAPLCFLLEDEDGTILAGYTGSSKRIKAGRTANYCVTINTAPTHAKVEVFPQWSSLNDTVTENKKDAS